ncbi:MAG: hypothetical protein HY852_16990 [Bradyrhizobium sp.]|uniref:hypothetical protein n=1 Tax=Bradyrhizobium sp. TaxID=376 RepID=UPI0025C0AA47|nr:hypothetical protein [Bradyrhizobium sp.]MBI5263508.1 hypothetical protein [Bradyrhizobium sp.]
MSALRRSLAAACLALLALVMQVAATASHLAMQAATVGEPTLALDQIGLLSLCIQGDEALPPHDEGGLPKKTVSPCVVCQAVKVAAHGMAPLPPVHIPPVEPTRAPTLAEVDRGIISRLLLRYGVTRGPPSSFFA